MTRVVDRCPSCGVEHDVRVDACEACDTPLRAWCRAHSREIGWLDGPACPRCAHEAARRTPVPPARRPPARPDRRREPAPARVRPPVEHKRRFWSQSLGRRTLQGAAYATAVVGVFAIMTDAAGAAIFEFGWVGLVVGAMWGWVSAVYSDPDADHR